MLLTSVEAGLHKHADGLDTELEVLGRDVSSVAHDEGERLHTLDEGLGVVQAHVLAQGQAVLVHQREGQRLRATGPSLTAVQVILTHLRTRTRAYTPMLTHTDVQTRKKYKIMDA